MGRRPAEPKQLELELGADTVEVKDEPTKVAAKPEFTDEELADFKAWKAAKSVKVVEPEVVMKEDKARALWKEESRMVKGIFRCHEPQGGSVQFSFKKFKWDPVRTYTMKDGEVYEVPLAVARHLNQNCNYPVHSHVLDASGNPTVDRNRVKSRMNFESTEFSFV